MGKQPTTLNVRVRPNVICTELINTDGTFAGESLREWQVAKKVAYWEILEFARECPLKFGGRAHRRENLTEQQRIQLEKFLDPGRNVRHLWPEQTGCRFESFPATIVDRPFFAGESTEWSTTAVSAAPREEPISLPVVASREVRDRVEKKPEHPSCVVPAAAPQRQVDEQDLVIRAPADLQQLVLAPPGTGKTHVLVKRLRHLIASGMLDNPSRQVLVLSFSRAAVAEVTRRIEAELADGAHDDLRYVQVRTFDSYATRMLTRGEAEGTWLEAGYSNRIRQFRNGLAGESLPEAAREELESLRYLIVDELQDLVGERAKMALQMIGHVQRLGGAVLLLGDPAQAIYDWQLPEDDNMSSSTLLEFARAALKSPLGTSVERELKHYRRYQNKQMLDFVRRCRKAVGNDGHSPDLTELTNQLQGLANVATGCLRNTAESSESVAVLTRTNLEAYQISEWCRTEGVPYRVERGSSGRYWPGWIARLCFGYQMDKMSLNIARRRWEEFVAGSEWASFEQAQDFLRRHGQCDNNVLDLRELSRLIERSQPYCSWPQGESGRLTISTIHRSKGLEFDRVFLLKAQPGRFSAGDTDEGQGEARVLYVAATRARSDLAMLMRDSQILRTGNKYCKGYSFSRLNHFHLYNAATGCNYLLLDGTEELDLQDMLRSASRTDAIDFQNEVWALRGGNGWCLNAGRIDGVLSWQLPSGRRLCSVSRELSISAAQLGKTYRGGNAEAVRRLVDVPIVDLATVSFAWEGGVSTERGLGTAKLLIVPVLYGLAHVGLG